jgi:hypothetical protein
VNLTNSRGANARRLTEQKLRAWFEYSEDVQISSANMRSNEGALQPVILFYCLGMIDKKQINEVVLPHLEKMLATASESNPASYKSGELLELHTNKDLYDLENISVRLYSGELFILIEEQQLLYSINIANPPQRSPEESSTEISIKGPRDAFTEDLTTNIALVRKRLKSRSMCCQKMTIGRRSHTDVAILYIKDIANEEVLEQVKNRLNGLDIDGLISSAQLEESLAESKYALFPLIDYIGRPDYIATALLKGRFAILLDGAPMALIGPSNLLVVLKSPEDIHLPFYYVALERILRIVGLIMAIFLPGFWVAVSSYNLDQIPFPLLATITSSRLGLPISGPLDFFIMLGLFEVFREAGVRLPRAVGQTVAVVGGLIIGDAAIRAGFTSPTTLVVTAVSTVANFTLINQSLVGSVSIMRVVVLIMSAAFGIFGFMMGLLAVCLHLSSLESFGLSYLAPVSPLNIKDLVRGMDFIPWSKTKWREKFLKTKDPTRKGDSA